MSELNPIHGGKKSRVLEEKRRREELEKNRRRQEEREQAARDFAQALYLALRADQMAELTGKEGRP